MMPPRCSFPKGGERRELSEAFPNCFPLAILIVAA